MFRELIIDIFLLITAHIFGDYVFQNDFLANFKGKYKFICAIHSWIWSCCILTVLFLRGYNSLPESFVFLLCTHYILDRLKCFIEDKSQALTKDLWIDQAWHISTILLIVALEFI